MPLTMREAAVTAQPLAQPLTQPLFRPRLWLTRHLPLMVATAVILAALGPYGTFQDLTLPGRLAYWGGMMLFGFLAYQGVMALGILAAGRIGARTGRAVPWPAVVVPVTLVVNGLITAAVAAVETRLGRSGFDGVGGMTTLYVYCLIVTAVVTVLPLRAELLSRGTLTPPAPPAPLPEPVVPTGEPRFLDRIPPRLGRRLLALEMEDHYLRIHTDAGSALILMRLRDAVAELDGFPGQQVHRSFWVARDAVTGVERRADGKLTLVLCNGLKVPVSRTHAPAVRAAGWV